MTGAAGLISILAAGRLDRGYANRVNEFNWEEFYSKWHGFGFIEYLKEQLRKQADIIIIDSRTGVTDIGGICTLQLPDAVVLLFALNEQNIAGAESVAESIMLRATEVGKREKPPALILRPSRVDKFSEEDKKIKFEEMAAKRLGIYLPSSNSEDALVFMKKKSIPYIASYSFGETPLAVQKDPYGDLASAFDDVSASILSFADIAPLDSEQIRKRRRLLSLRHITISLLSPRWTTEAALFLLLVIGTLVGYRSLERADGDTKKLRIINANLSDENSSLKERLRPPSDDTLRQLVTNLFSDQNDVRTEAGAEIVAKWSNDEKLVPILIATATQNPNNKNGVFNTLVMLDAVQVAALGAHLYELGPLFVSAESAGKECALRVGNLRTKIDNYAAVVQPKISPRDQALKKCNEDYKAAVKKANDDCKAAEKTANDGYLPVEQKANADYQAAFKRANAAYQAAVKKAAASAPPKLPVVESAMKERTAAISLAQRAKTSAISSAQSQKNSAISKARGNKTSATSNAQNVKAECIKIASLK